jgi:DNA-binding transcriptional regulator LsrR (DeoR family)
MESLIESGVAGDIVAHQFDEYGRWMDIPANRRAISLDADSLRRIPRVIAVSGGVSKARAILAGLRGRLCTCLVTDARTAQAVLELHRQSQQRAARSAEGCPALHRSAAAE